MEASFFYSLYLLCDILTEVHQDLCHFGTGSCTIGIELTREWNTGSPVPAARRSVFHFDQTLFSKGAFSFCCMLE